MYQYITIPTGTRRPRQAFHLFVRPKEDWQRRARALRIRRRRIVQQRIRLGLEAKLGNNQ